MKVEISDRKLRESVGDLKKLTTIYGSGNARMIIQRINELESIPNLGLMVTHRIGRCHRLKGDFTGKYALDLELPKRLIIKPKSQNHGRKSLTVEFEIQ
ncbi:MAG: hypothetical protein J7K89_09195 [Candidatus Cloacimonetes bacterium]|nr:hypothetical protein [Candidatus Cloacimonadota bacterium]